MVIESSLGKFELELSDKMYGVCINLFNELRCLAPNHLNVCELTAVLRDGWPP